ncbi:hypothetical protein GYMLUDRAFT_57599 [Collybiopsis luxurians FD-317 M1]|uniref:MACPF domain-containing protein n=1 Tax=Collybiopsis luxurians FD-317 M1 TaxID=944289 RepID=A0A0D0BHB0_9AGAR|nr:hypothetical protein GYMLUDRAFT_57599 [Collybiopsis luxurians FD-317 M1]
MPRLFASHPTVDSFSIFQLGQGVNAITGQPRGHALGSFTNENIVTGEGPTCNVHARVINEFHQLDSDVRIASNATINLGTPAASITQTAELLKSKALSQREFIIECTIEGQYEYDKLLLKDLRLTPDAQKIFERSHTDFRNLYGDYFVVGFRRRYRSYTILVCRAGERTDTTEAKAEAQGHFQSFLSLGADLNQSIKNSNKYIVANAFISQYGCHSFPSDTPRSSQQSSVLSVPAETDFGSALTALKDTVSHAIQYNGTPKEAILMHYSSLVIDPASGSLLGINLPTEISVSPTIFEVLHRTEELCMKLDIDCLHPALDTYRLTVRDAQSATRTFRSGRPGFAGGDDRQRDSAILNVDEAVKSVDNIIQRYRLMEYLLGSAWGPDIGEKVKLGGKNPGRRSCGVVTTEGGQGDIGVAQSVTLNNGLPAFQVNLVQGRKKERGLLWNPLSKPNAHFKVEQRSRANTRSSVDESSLQLDFSFKGSHYARDDFYIVGWTITSENPSRSSSFRVQYGGIMENNLDMALTGEEDSRWTCRIVYILKKDYNFPNLINTRSAFTHPY